MLKVSLRHEISSISVLITCKKQHHFVTKTLQHQHCLMLGSEYNVHVIVWRPIMDASQPPDRKTVGLILFLGTFYSSSLTFVLTTRSSHPLRAFSSVWQMKNDFRGSREINQSCSVHIALLDSFYIVCLARRHACNERQRVVWTSVMETWDF